MKPLEGELHPEAMDKAVQFRDAVFERLPRVLLAPHSPALSPEEKDRVLAKLAYLEKNEYRAAYFLTLYSVAGLQPGTEAVPTQLPALVKVWAGLREKPKQRETGQKVGHARNGHVIRSTRGRG